MSQDDCGYQDTLITIASRQKELADLIAYQPLPVIDKVLAYAKDVYIVPWQD